MTHVKTSQDPGPGVNLLAYERHGCIFYQSFLPIDPGQQLTVCLKHVKLEHSLDVDGLQSKYMKPGPKFMALLTAKFCAYDHRSPLARQALCFCASCVSTECIVMWNMHAHKSKFPANP